MQIPEAFYEFCLLLHQDSFDVYGREPEDLAAGPLLYLSKEQKVSLKAFLNELLNGDYSEAQLQESYRKGDADISFSPVRYLFELARDAIDRGA